MKKKVSFHPINTKENLKLQPVSSDFVNHNIYNYNEKDLTKIYSIFFEFAPEIAKIIVSRGHEQKDKCKFFKF